jgi:hypothetical protein
LRGVHPQSDFIKLEQQEVPSLLETMSVEPGVTLREKGASKQGPKEEASDGRMTRADFMTLVQSTADLAQQSSFLEAREVRGSQLMCPWFEWINLSRATVSPPQFELPLGDENIALGLETGHSKAQH